MIKIAVILTLAALIAGCGGGGGDPVQDVRIISINLNPGAAVIGSVIELTASISAPGMSVSDLIKNWTVTTGTLSTTPPEFSLVTRQTAQAGEASVSTTRNSVYWTVPQSTGQATITLETGNDTESRVVTVSDSQLSMTVSTTGEGNKVCTVRANSVQDLFFAAFRVNYSGNWTPSTVEQGDFLGEPETTVFLGLTNQNGFVPVAVSKRGTAAGEDGSGILATVTFTPKQSGSSTSSALADRPFTLEGAYLTDSEGNQIITPY